MQFDIKAGSCDGWSTLFAHVDRHGDGRIREAVLLTPHGFVWSQSDSREDEGEKAQTVFYFVQNGTVFRTVIEGKQYKPRGMQKLALEFASQCVSQQRLDERQC